MSGMLITMKDDHAQDFKDDLESTIYVLLWVAIMYSSCSNAAHAAGFLRTVLDPQPYSGTTYTAKPDFLKGRDFFQLVKFPGWPHLDQLLINLAKLFSACYEPSSGQDNIDAADALLANVPEAEQSCFIRFVSVLWCKECLKHQQNVNLTWLTWWWLDYFQVTQVKSSSVKPVKAFMLPWFCLGIYRNMVCFKAIKGHKLLSNIKYFLITHK